MKQAVKLKVEAPAVAVLGNINPEAGTHVIEIPIEQIRPAPWNPGGRMDPEGVNELADSIAAVGQQEPALVRPVEADPPVKYEMVFGHRRLAACRVLASRPFTFAAGRPQGIRLRAFVRDMSEEEAMILSGVENLQRQGFSDIEEAEFFRTCGARYGESAVKILAEKLSVSEKYVRKRVRILELPEAALKLWRSGTWHVGHMEQLLRLGENKEVTAFLENLKNRYGYSKKWVEELQVWQLKGLIDDLAVPLAGGHFDKADCKVCRKNTDCQLRLFGGEKEKGAKCLDQDCFRKKQQAWLDVNWSGCKANKSKTRAAVVGDYHTKSTGSFYGGFGDPKPSGKCASCPQYTTVLTLDGTVLYDRCCMGEKNCYSAVKTAEKKAERVERDGGQTDPDAPRVPWHGEYFRQEFYRQQFPDLVSALPTEDTRRLQLALVTIVHYEPQLEEWIARKLGVEIPEKEHEWETYHLETPDLIKLIRPLDPIRIERLLAEASAFAAFEVRFKYSDPDRQALAEFLDIDFSKFEVSEEYLQKKTKGELVRFILDVGLDKEARFQDAMEAHGIPTVEKLAAAKKPVLVDLIRNCGVSLRGRVPKEIADRPKLGMETERTPESPSIPDEPLTEPKCWVCGCNPNHPCSEECEGLVNGEDVGLKGMEGHKVCSTCAERILEEQGEDSGKEDDSCVVCKSAHPWCDECCRACSDPCNAEQGCRKGKVRGGEDILKNETM